MALVDYWDIRDMTHLSCMKDKGRSSCAITLNPTHLFLSKESSDVKILYSYSTHKNILKLPI